MNDVTTVVGTLNELGVVAQDPEVLRVFIGNWARDSHHHFNVKIYPDVDYYGETVPGSWLSQALNGCKNERAAGVVQEQAAIKRAMDDVAAFMDANDMTGANEGEDLVVFTAQKGDKSFSMVYDYLGEDNNQWYIR